MGRQIIRQPNGKLAVFSSIVDNFVFLDMTPEEYIQERIAEETMLIRGRVMRTLERMEDGTKYPFQKTWNEALEIVRITHGDEAVKEVLKNVG